MQSVLILGAGINGAAIARELVLNGVGVWVVDQADLASGATAYSSRLIHGGLRYLEYGEFGLVRESLDERTRLLRLAPQYVRPLRLFIPVRDRWGGWAAAVARFVRRGKRSAGKSPARGLSLVRLGFWLYDGFARDPLLPRRAIYRADDPRAPPVDLGKFRWQCAYSDAAIQYPERFVIALLEDARQEAARQGIEFRLLTYHQAAFAGQASSLSGRREAFATKEATSPAAVQVIPTRGARPGEDPPLLSPSAIVNATGAWVDHTLQTLRIDSRQLIGGTKGSHFVSSHPGLRRALAGRGIYAEAADGRPVFLLPLGENSLVGTTDIPFPDDPATAVATDEELAYLLDAANLIFPELQLSHRDIDWHYSGVRPLPHLAAATPSAITRRHWLEEHKDCPLPLYSVIGGKLTTCRSLAEETVDVLLRRLGLPRTASSRERPIPGGENYPPDAVALQHQHRRLTAQFDLPIQSIAACWQLYGTRTESVLQCCGDLHEMLAGTALPAGLVRHVIQHEWAEGLDDLVCRRLMLLHAPRLSATTLAHLEALIADAPSAAGIADPGDIEAVRGQLLLRYGKQIDGADWTSHDRGLAT